MGVVMIERYSEYGNNREISHAFSEQYTYIGIKKKKCYDMNS